MKRAVLIVACLIIGGCMPPNPQFVAAAHAHDADRAQVVKNAEAIDSILKKWILDLTWIAEDSFQEFYDVGKKNNEITTRNIANLKSNLAIQLKQAEEHINSQFRAVDKRLSEVIEKYNEIVRTVNDHMLDHETMPAGDGFTRP